MFRNARDLTLTGRLLVPATPGPHPAVVFAHAWGSSKDSPRNRAVAEALRRLGFAAFLFDFTGHGESEGTPEDSTQAQQVADLAATLDALEGFEEVDRHRLGVVGASSGAAVVVPARSETRGSACWCSAVSAVRGRSKSFPSGTTSSTIRRR